MSREAMQQALEVLENAGEAVYARGGIAAVGSLNIAAQALRKALETEQEPVAWMYVNKDGECEQIEYGPVFDDPGVTPLYTAPPKRDLTCVCGAVWEGKMMVHPPRKREWVGLTDDEIMEPWPFENRIAFARWLESKLKKKNT